ncbi:PadR family transcriptional regulator [Christensenella intestinihominis]|uniref:PadR family transcriptional regulator n=1 Tax=Christensenella intestinihominis TaxID=1851429 RepID=UPI000833E122|nr:PadR family transcriptional regulator [Christensenella intestinihominis]
MDVKKAEKRYLPMSETMFYILLSLREKRHGYAVMLHVEEITKGRVKIGAGTMYQSISKLAGDGLIAAAGEEGRQKKYQVTALGMHILQAEAQRIRDLFEAAEELL